MMIAQQLKERPAQAKAAVEVTDINFSTDGTCEGSKLSINGKEVENLLSVSFYMWDEDCGKYLGCSYTVGDKHCDVQPGSMSESHTYRLVSKQCGSASKAIAEAKGNPAELKKAYANHFGMGDAQSRGITRIQ